MNQFDKLSAEAIQTALDGRIPLPEIHALVDSTNQRAKVLAREGAPAFTAVIADNQTKGHGRYGRHFHSASGGGLYMTLILRPTLDSALLPQLTHYAALAAAEALESLVPSLHIEIKWVNDLYIGRKKIAGILNEAGFSHAASPDYMICGIGINVADVFFPMELQEIATSLAAETHIEQDALLLVAPLLSSLEQLYPTLNNGDFLQESKRRSVLLGKEIIVHSQGMDFPAIAKDIDALGRLVIDCGGTTSTLCSGEVSVHFPS